VLVGRRDRGELYRNHVACRACLAAPCWLRMAPV
jgi:hypothetical protein